eukprot:COSAG01_NODE_2012_length_8655_cov_3.344086_3_plen_762_part_00
MRLMTDEQKAIVDCARPPSMQPVPPAVRVTAGAGTGKTTVLHEVVVRLDELGHTKGQYVAFGKAAAADAKVRMQAMGGTGLPRLEVSTADSCARRAMQTAGYNPPAPMGDDQFRREVGILCQDDIRATITGQAEGLSPAKMLRLEKQIATFIYRTVEKCFMFSARSVADGFDWQQPRSVYYPAELWHNRQGDSRIPEAPPGVPKMTNGVKQFYVAQARKVWGWLTAPDSTHSTHSVVMKQAQLLQLKIPGTYLLVDEVQDLNPCQLDWFCQQHRCGTHAFFVGDMAQQIYSFRGAKSGPLLEYPDARDLALTQSFRFGENIAKIANIVLFLKLNSTQTSCKDSVQKWRGFRSHKKQRLWNPYCVKGCAMDAGQIGWRTEAEVASSEAESADTSEASTSVSSSLMDDYRGPVTLLAVANHTLMAACLPRVLKSLSNGQPLKVAINGKGEASGLRKWQTVFQDVEHFARLWDLSGPMVPLERKKGTILPFKQFEDETELMWETACHIVKQQELQRFESVLAIVSMYKERTRKVMALWKEHVLDKQYNQDEANVVLSTIHSAKGMEWDDVEICGDSMCALSAIKVVDCEEDGQPTRVAAIKSASSPCTGPNPRAMFDMKEFGDDLNLWYVAVTRAKKRLSLPTQLKELMDDIRVISDFADGGPVTNQHKRRRQSDEVACSQPDEPPPDSPAVVSAWDTLQVKGQTFDRVNAKLIVRDLKIPLLPPGLGSWQNGSWTWQQVAEEGVPRCAKRQLDLATSHAAPAT